MGMAEFALNVARSNQQIFQTQIQSIFPSTKQHIDYPHPHISPAVLHIYPAHSARLARKLSIMGIIVERVADCVMNKGRSICRGFIEKRVGGCFAPKQGEEWERNPMK
jgi:hypothetical protein